MSLHSLHSKQRVPISMEKAWDFFSSPANLKTITPPYMGFEITSGFNADQKMYAGMIISYVVKPVLNIPMTWVTEITQVKHLHYFIDEQRFGPYTLWHHKHFFHEIPGGVEMTDLVHYKLPLGFIGDMMNTLYVRKQLREIFDFRTQKLIDLFGKMDDALNPIQFETV
jgi:ligand-binding SRPBCC domain-containing protein